MIHTLLKLVSLPVKSLEIIIVFEKSIFFAHRGCIYLIKQKH